MSAHALARRADTDRATFPIVQISLDLTSLDDALDTAAIAVDAGVDWLEAGTPLLKLNPVDGEVVTVGIVQVTLQPRLCRESRTIICGVQGALLPSDQVAVQG